MTHFDMKIFPRHQVSYSHQSPTECPVSVPVARAGTARPGGASYTYHRGTTGRRGENSSGYTTGGYSGPGHTTGSRGSYSNGYNPGGGGGFWGAAPTYGDSHPPRPSAPPQYGWSVPAEGADAGADAGADDAELAEAIRRSRQTYSEETERRRYSPTAPPL